MQIVITANLDDSQITQQKAEELEQQMLFAAEGMFEQCFPTMGRAGKNIPDHEFTSQIYYGKEEK